MLIVNEILGNVIADEQWEKIYNQMSCDGKVHAIMFSRLESERCLLLKRLPELNEEMRIDLKRGMVLHLGDILYYKTGDKMFIANIEAEEMMVLKFVGKVHEEALFEAAVRLGHAIGNQHWQIKVVGKTVFVPVALDRKVMESVIKTHNIPGIEYVFAEVGGEKISIERYEHFHNFPHGHNSHIHSHTKERVLDRE